MTHDTLMTDDSIMADDIVKRYSRNPIQTKDDIPHPVERRHMLDYISESRESLFQPPNRSEPTQAQPGSTEKLRVMIDRYRSGQPLHHPSDATCVYRLRRARNYYGVFDQETNMPS